MTRSAQCFSRNVPILEEFRSFGNHMRLFQFRDKDRVRTSSKFDVFSTQWPEELSSIKPPCGFPSHPHPYSSCKAQGVLALYFLDSIPCGSPTLAKQASLHSPSSPGLGAPCLLFPLPGSASPRCPHGSSPHLLQSAEASSSQMPCPPDFKLQHHHTPYAPPLV